ncbi:hypothetical protein DDB_G0280383 [Dictyostelium discoideum AX4]|uniref:Uncharacterized protein n=1 Tax=Dictyostelium discoideum TaxID=44689 RepID=Q54VP5_DICDI|nr:hypothetical protein DDB_G0280383 [Dictyostelium discoideum AX4]EAL67418.1 hypothetical protein DDB_G0280383 [Dictyostelium discoideum AX4]|eukprot:XP_641310.1 hypothetical protein DDB_G0280383 [Dictyostelium discoideum AX4]
MQPPRESTIDICHLGTLFVIDKRRTGRFYHNDILEFARTYASQALLNGRKDDFQSKFQAYCTLKMWNEISKDRDEIFVEWFTKLFTENPNYIQKFDQHSETYLTSDAINKMYQILSIKNYYGGDFRSFLDLMQRSAEEEDLMKLDEDELDDVVPAQILKNFSKHFIDGFKKLMVSKLFNFISVNNLIFFFFFFILFYFINIILGKKKKKIYLNLYIY